MAVFVLDKRKKPLMPCSEKRARLLLEKKRAVVHKIEPFTIRLKDRTQEDSELQSQRIKIDPGAKVTGIAIITETNTGKETKLLGEIHHRTNIKEKIKKRSDRRKSRRSRKTRYRIMRFNRKIPEGWLPPSLKSRANQTVNIVKKLKTLTPLNSCSIEHVKFDTQLLQNKNVQGAEYQHGTLFEYELKEYLLEKYGRKCVYCERADVPFEKDHVRAKANGGTNRISNLVIACVDCNVEKGKLYLNEWKKKLLKRDDKKAKIILNNIDKIDILLKEPLKEVAFMNSVRWELVNQIKDLFNSIEYGTGARTKMNRYKQNFPKTHYYDALFVGKSGSNKVNITTSYVQIFKSEGRGSRQMAHVDRYGFPLFHLAKDKYTDEEQRKGHRQRKKTCHGFSTGDICKVVVPNGKKAGKYRGRITIRHSGKFGIKDYVSYKKVDGISYLHFSLLQRNDGWSYSKKAIS